MNTTSPSISRARPVSSRLFNSVASGSSVSHGESCDPESSLAERQQMLPLPIQKRQQQNEHHREDTDCRHRSGDSIRGRDQSGQPSSVAEFTSTSSAYFYRMPKMDWRWDGKRMRWRQLHICLLPAVRTDADRGRLGDHRSRQMGSSDHGRTEPEW